MRRRVTSGRLLIATGVLHLLVGAIEGRDPLGQILADGWVAAVGLDDPSRVAIFWFQFGGIFMLLYGLALHDLERATGRPPGRHHGWLLIVVSLLGGLATPVSGFWLVLAQGMWILWRHSP